MTGNADVPLEITARLRETCLGLPAAYEQSAWVGTRWLVRKHTFAHVLTVEAGRPAAYARAADNNGPITVLTFRALAAEQDALLNIGPPFFWCGWGRSLIGMRLDGPLDWQEITKLLTDSYCLLAPNKLIQLVHPRRE